MLVRTHNEAESDNYTTGALVPLPTKLSFTGFPASVFTVVSFSVDLRNMIELRSRLDPVRIKV